MRKDHLQSMKDLAASKGGTCLSKEYVSSKSKLQWMCREGHIWETVPIQIKKGRWCPNCAGNTKNTIESMQKIAIARGGECLSTNYKNSKTKLQWRCGSSHLFRSTPDAVKNKGSWCPFCLGRNKTIEDMKQIAREKGGQCLSKEYLGWDKKLKWQCSKGHVWTATPNSIQYRSWCPDCGGSKPLNIELFKKIANERGGDCLSKTYKNVSSKLNWRCSEGHVWLAVPTLIKRGSWCPKCSEGLGERICRAFFEHIFNAKFPKSRPEWLENEKGNQIELDGFCSDLSLAFEHQGEQHFRHVKKYHSKSEFEQRRLDDSTKLQLCKLHGVTLILVPEIPEFLKINRVKEFIISECRNQGFKGVPTISKKIDLSEAYIPNKTQHFQKLKDIAKEKGGRCTSDIYLGDSYKLSFQCAKGHKWKATPNHIKNGTWCPICCGKQKSTIDQMSKIAEERKGKCLSKIYVNDRTKLNWECSRGHVWQATPSDIKRGKWCPICAGNKKLDIQFAQAMATRKGGVCLTNDYVNSESPMKWKCSKGHIWKARLRDINRNHWCPDCAGTKKKTLEDMQKIALEKSGKCLSAEYVNCKTKLDWQCEKGHIWSATPDNVSGGSWCPKCRGKNKTIDDMQAFAKRKGGRCLSKEYFNNKTKLMWQCKDGHKWETAPSNIISGTWCPTCAGRRPLIN